MHNSVKACNATELRHLNMVQMATFMGCVFYHSFLKRRGEKMLTRACRLLWSHVAVQKPSLREAGRAVWTSDCYVLKAGAAGPRPGPQSVSSSTFGANQRQSASSPERDQRPRECGSG